MLIVVFMSRIHVVYVLVYLSFMSWESLGYPGRIPGSGDNK